MVIRLDQKRMKRKHLHQKRFLRIHHDLNTAALETFHDLLVNTAADTGRDASGKHQNISGFQLVQLFEQKLHICSGDVRPHAVDLGLLI